MSSRFFTFCDVLKKCTPVSAPKKLIFHNYKLSFAKKSYLLSLHDPIYFHISIVLASQPLPVCLCLSFNTTNTVRCAKFSLTIREFYPIVF